MRKALYSHIQNLTYSYHAQAETGDLIQRCTSDVELINKFVNSQLLEILRSLTLITFAVSIMFSINRRMALIGIAVTPVVFFTAVVYFRKERDAFQKWDESEGALSATLQENLTGIRVVKAFARQAFEQQKFHEKNSELRRHGWKTFQVIANFWMFSDFICLTQIAAVTIIGTLVGYSVAICPWDSWSSSFRTPKCCFIPLRGLARIIGSAGTNANFQQPAAGDPGRADRAGRVRVWRTLFCWAASLFPMSASAIRRISGMSSRTFLFKSNRGKPSAY
jgi:ABC-type multidrug transport system fused ATPase/permease subunit